MSVAHLSSMLSGGAGIATLRIHQAILKSGADSRLVVPKPTIDGDGIMPCWRDENRWARAARRLNPWDSIKVWRRQIAKAKSRDSWYELFSPPTTSARWGFLDKVKNASILHLHWTATTLDYARDFREFDMPIVWTLHDQNPCLGGFHWQYDVDANPSMRNLEAKAREIKRKALADKRIAVIGVSEWITGDASQSTVLPKAHLYRTIYYPLDGQAYQPRDKTACKRALQIESNRIVIGFACDNLRNRRKGLDILAQALRVLPHSIQDRLLLLSFGRPAADELRSLVTIPWIQLDFITGEALRAIAYSAMDVFVLPSRADNYPQTGVEALACGTTVVGSNVGGIPEIVDFGHCGLLFDPNNPTDLSEKLTILIDDGVLRKKLAKAGREMVLERHSPARVAQQYVEIYKNLLDDRKS